LALDDSAIDGYTKMVISAKGGNIATIRWQRCTVGVDMRSAGRPYIRPESAGSWISRSQGVKPSRSIRYQSEQSKNQIIYKGATASQVGGEAAPWEPTRSKIATSRRSGLGYQESPN